LVSGLCVFCFCGFFFFKQKTAYEMLRSLVGSEMCIRDRQSLLGAQMGQLSCDLARSRALINLYQSLGGGR